MKCVQCGNEEFVEAVVPERCTVGGREFAAGLPVEKCRRCGETYTSDAVLSGFERIIAARLAQEGPVTGETFRFLRKSVSLKGSEIAELLGVAPETVSRWENSQRPVDMAAWATLASIVVDSLQNRSLTLDRLRAARSGKAPRVDVGSFTSAAAFGRCIGKVIGNILGGDEKPTDALPSSMAGAPAKG